MKSLSRQEGKHGPDWLAMAGEILHIGSFPLDQGIHQLDYQTIDHMTTLSHTGF